jgi:REP element-mobilizing transposase RayT
MRLLRGCFVGRVPRTRRRLIKGYPMLPQRKAMHLKTFDYLGPDLIYFITICTSDKKLFFADRDFAAAAVDEIKHRRNMDGAKIYCYCLMPDHLHLLLSLGTNYDKNLQTWVSSFKRYMSRIARDQFYIARLWQRNFYDRVVRGSERSPNGPNELTQKAQYILNNPVRKMMVSTWEEYPFCGIIDQLP